MLGSLSFFTSEKTKKISFQTLSETEKQTVESAYKVYFDAREEKTSCNLEEQTQPVLDPETGNPLYLIPRNNVQKWPGIHS